MLSNHKDTLLLTGKLITSWFSTGNKIIENPMDHNDTFIWHFPEVKDSYKLNTELNMTIVPRIDINQKSTGINDLYFFFDVKKITTTEIVIRLTNVM